MRTETSSIDILQIILIILKITGVITWKWIYVLFPLWFSLATALGVMIIIGFDKLINK